MMAGAAMALCLAGCAGQSAHMIAEKADVDAQLAYVTVATLCNAYESRAGADVAKGEAIKLEAWKALLVERQGYALTGTVNLSALTALVAQAKGL